MIGTWKGDFVNMREIRTTRNWYHGWHYVVSMLKLKNNATIIWPFKNVVDTMYIVRLVDFTLMQLELTSIFDHQSHTFCLLIQWPSFFYWKFKQVVWSFFFFFFFSFLQTKHKLLFIEHFYAQRKQVSTMYIIPSRQYKLASIMHVHSIT